VNSGEKVIQKTESDNPDIILMAIRLIGEMDGSLIMVVFDGKIGLVDNGAYSGDI